MDDYELTPEIQKEVKKCWEAVTTDTVKEYCDIEGYWEDFTICLDSVMTISTIRRM